MIRLFAFLLLLVASPVAAQGWVSSFNPSSGTSTAPSPLYVAGSYTATLAATIGSASTYASGNIRYYPILIGKALTFNSLGVNIGTPATNGNAQLTIYAPSAAGSAGTVIGGCSVSTGTAGPVSCLISSGTGTGVIPAPGVYFFALETDTTAGPTATFTSISSSFLSAPSLTGTTLANSFGGGVYYIGHVFSAGTYPDLTSSSPSYSSSAPAPAGAFRVASIP